MQKISAAGDTFLRPGGREGRWILNSADDDYVVSPFDFVEVAGNKAEAMIMQLQSDQPDKTPILFGSPHEAGILFERMNIWPETSSDWLSTARNFDPEQWLNEREDDHIAKCDKYGSDWPRRGAWPETEGDFNQLLVPNAFLKPGTAPVVVIGLIPTSDPTEVGAYLRFGGWNDCPRPQVHVAFARRWRDKYGARQISNTYESIEFRIAKPLADRDEAMELAVEQYFYCTDSMPDTMEIAAAELIGATVWHFWWD